METTTYLRDKNSEEQQSEVPGVEQEGDAEAQVVNQRQVQDFTDSLQRVGGAAGGRWKHDQELNEKNNNSREEKPPTDLCVCRPCALRRWALETADGWEHEICNKGKILVTILGNEQRCWGSI